MLGEAADPGKAKVIRKTAGNERIHHHFQVFLEEYEERLP